KTRAGDGGSEVAAEKEEATVWVEGLDTINRTLLSRERERPEGLTPVADASGSAGIQLCVDLSATPFYLKGSGHPEGRPFPWLVSDFGLVDAMESGIVKIPRLPVSDTTGRPDAKYCKLWQTINDSLAPAERPPGIAGQPKAEGG